MVTRRAILIGVPGVKNYLPGVKQDLKKMKSYLKSQNGGEWWDEEIITLYSASWYEVMLAVKNIQVDYNFVYFSGHGFTSGMDRMICLADRNISDTNLFNSCPRQQITIDACRTLAREIGSLPEPRFRDRWASFTGMVTRELFDQFILDSPSGKTITHSTQPGTYSYDSASGGVFTNNLLRMSSSFKSQDGIRKFTIEQIIRNVPKALWNGQIPEVVYKDGDLKVPFLVAHHLGALQKTRSVKKRQLNSKSSDLSDLGLILGIGAVILAGIVLSD